MEGIGRVYMGALDGCAWWVYMGALDGCAWGH